VLANSASSFPTEHQHHLAMAGMTPAASGIVTQWWFSAGLHTLGYLGVTALVALVVYYRVGVAILRKAWFNFDYLWVGALIVSGILTIAM